MVRVNYGTDRGQHLDVYAPMGASSLPVLLFLHGGAWINGHLGWLRFMAPALLSLPAILVAATYRLAPRCRWPAQEEDAHAALNVVYRAAAEWGGDDPGRIVIGGHSAGAQLAALKGERPPLRACMPVSGPLDLRYGDVPLESDVGRVYRYLFTERSQDATASPIAFTSGSHLPFHLIWGECDLDRVQDAGVRMVEALECAVAPVTHAVLPGASHFDTHLALRDPQHDWYNRFAALSAQRVATAEEAAS